MILFPNLYGRMVFAHPHAQCSLTLAFALCTPALSERNQWTWTMELPTVWGVDREGGANTIRPYGVAGMKTAWDEKDEFII